MKRQDRGEERGIMEESGGELEGVIGGVWTTEKEQGSRDGEKEEGRRSGRSEGREMGVVVLLSCDSSTSAAVTPQ